MSWNEPGGNNKQDDPWNKKHDQDFDQVIAKFIHKLRNSFGFKKNKHNPNDGVPQRSPENALNNFLKSVQHYKTRHLLPFIDSHLTKNFHDL